MRAAYLAVLFVSFAVFGCKVRTDSVSGVRSVVAKDSGGNLIVYYKDKSGDEKVYRKACTATEVGTPSGCPTTPAKAERPWSAYKNALLASGLSIVKTNGIKEALESSTAWDSQGQSDLIQKMDQAFDADIDSGTNPFTVAFIGTPQGGSAPIPTESMTTLKLSKDLVLEEMRDARDWFTAGDTQFRNAPHPFPSDAIVSQSVMQACLNNGSSISYWSDIVFHYYCQFGQLRGCFTGQVSGGPKTYDHYKKGYDHCIANDANFKRYFDGSVAGIDYDRRRTVFQHIMFSVYTAGRVNLFDRDDQDEVINKFHNSETNCNARPTIPRSSSDPLHRPNGKHCGKTSTTPPVNPPPSNGGSSTPLVSVQGFDYYKVSVSGTMLDKNLLQACQAAGLVVPCNDGQNGEYSDSRCFDSGLKDRGDPMTSVAAMLCSGNKPSACSALDGVFQYMGEKWTNGSSCGVDGSTWCANGGSYSGKSALCVKSGNSQPQLPPTNAGALVTINGRPYFRVFVTGAMTDDNVLAACTSAGKKVPCVNDNAGDYSDAKCLDVGFRDGGNPMASIAQALCGSTKVGSCNALNGAYQYMGHKWTNNTSSCGVDGSTWCSDGANFSNKDAICVD